MTWKNSLIALSLCSALLPGTAAIAADHLDGSMTGVKADPSTDINDLYTWVSADGSKMYLIMTVFPQANKDTAKFSNAAYYVFHTASRMNFMTMQATPLDVICSFDAAQMISCWVGASYAGGNANDANGLMSTDGKFRVFAGPRKDHFFFNLDGFNATRTLVKTVNMATPIMFDANGCAMLNAGQTMAVRNQLKQSPTAGAPTDFFLPLNTLAIVLEVDKTLLTSGGSIFSVWAGTHKKM